MSASVAFCCVVDEKTKYLTQAVRWAQSIRWFGGSLAGADLVIGSTHPFRPEYEAEFDRLGVRRLRVEQASAWHGPSNKLNVLADPALAGYDVVMLTDCDVVMVGDVSDALQGYWIRAKPADAATLDDDILVPLFHAAGLPVPARRTRTTICGTEMVPYCNSGVVVLPSAVRDRFVQRWLHWNAFVLNQPERLGGHAFFTDQASFALALSEFIDSYLELPVELNFPCHFPLQSYPEALSSVQPRILHYHDHVDGRTGHIKPVGLPGVDAEIARFNARVGAERGRWLNNAVFWDERYLRDPELGSGIGSRGEHADYKAGLVEQFLASQAPGRVVDFGCGDCSLLERLTIADYVGVDGSLEVIRRNIERFPRHRFVHAQLPAVDERGEFGLCFDVLIHQSSREAYREVLGKVLSNCARGGLVNGFDEDPRFDSEIVYFHEPLRQTLEALGVEARLVGEYRRSVIYAWSHPGPT